MYQHNALQRQITATILRLRLSSPFFATLALFARISITTEVETAATDGRDIFFNADFWNALTLSERMGLVIHEVLHAALLHVPRRGQRDAWLWNIAADIVVNGIILSQTGFSLPEGHLRDEQLEQFSVEEVYHLIQKGESNYKLVMHDLLLTERGETQGGVASETYWRQALQQARSTADALEHGMLPAGLQRELTQLSPAHLDWRSYLWRFLVQTPSDFQGYDRRFIGQGFYLETLIGESVHVFIALDTSGSIDQHDMKQFLSEVVGILSAYPHLVVSLYYVDAACYGPYPLTEHAVLPNPRGGGGTDFRPFFEAIAQEPQEHESGVCVYLTDGYGTFPDEPGVLPTLWVLTAGGCESSAIPFGESVRLLPETT